MLAAQDVLERQREVVHEPGLGGRAEPVLLDAGTDELSPVVTLDQPEDMVPASDADGRKYPTS